MAAIRQMFLLAAAFGLDLRAANAQQKYAGETLRVAEVWADHGSSGYLKNSGIVSKGEREAKNPAHAGHSNAVHGTDGGQQRSEPTSFDVANLSDDLGPQAIRQTSF